MGHRKIEYDVFGKNAEEEFFLDSLNKALVDFECSQYRDFRVCPPCLHIVGLPRSGTTLLLQLMAARLRVGYISNLVAAFWRAPVTGIRLARKLAGDFRPNIFQSSYGRTNGLHNAHEFGYFWRELFGYKEMLEPELPGEKEIDWQFVRVVLGNICREFGCPVVFKSFLAQWHIPQLVTVLPNSCFIRVQRDPIDVAVSLVGMRTHYFGDKTSWVSLKPKQYHWLKDMPYWVQVAGQVYFLEKSLENSLMKADPSRVLEVDLPTLQSQPEGVLQEVHEFLLSNNERVEMIEIDRALNFSSGSQYSCDEDYRKIANAYEDFDAGKYD